MRIRTFLTIIVLLVIHGCSSNNEFDTPHHQFKSTSKIFSKCFKVDVILGNPRSMLVFDSLLVINDLSDNYHFTIINRHNGKLFKRFCMSGNGPNELLGVGSFWIDNESRKFYVFDVPKARLYSVSIEQLLNKESVTLFEEEKFDLDNGRIYSLAKTKAESFVGTGTFDSCAYFSQHLDSNREYFGEYYTEPNDEKIANNVKGMGIQGSVYSKPNSNIVTHASYHSGWLEFISLEQGSPKILQSHRYHPSDFKEILLPTGRATSAITERNRLGFLNSSATKQYFFSLYSGESILGAGNQHDLHYGNDVFVYGWEGEPVRHLILDKDLKTIAVTPNAWTLYGIGLDQDELLLFKYNLPKF